MYPSLSSSTAAGEWRTWRPAAARAGGAGGAGVRDDRSGSDGSGEEGSGEEGSGDGAGVSVMRRDDTAARPAATHRIGSRAAPLGTDKPIPSLDAGADEPPRGSSRHHVFRTNSQEGRSDV